MPRASASLWPFYLGARRALDQRRGAELMAWPTKELDELRSEACSVLRGNGGGGGGSERRLGGLRAGDEASSGLVPLPQISGAGACALRHCPAHIRAHLESALLARGREAGCAQRCG